MVQAEEIQGLVLKAFHGIQGRSMAGDKRWRCKAGTAGARHIHSIVPGALGLKEEPGGGKQQDCPCVSE